MGLTNINKEHQIKYVVLNKTLVTFTKVLVLLKIVKIYVIFVQYISKEFSILKRK